MKSRFGLVSMLLLVGCTHASQEDRAVATPGATAVGAGAAASPHDPAVPLAITHVSVVDVAEGSVRPDMTVVIRDGRIASVAPAATAAVPGDAVRYDGRGKYVLPGLWDMHVHLSYATESALPILVANGVTGVRDLGSHLWEIDGWRARIATGELVGPRIERAGPMVNGRSSNRFQLATDGPEQARGIVRALKQVGVDFIKTHRRTPRADYFAVVEEAKAQGLRLVGHVPLTVSPEEASDAGQLFEHTETLFEGTFSAGLPGGSGQADSAYAAAIGVWRAGTAPDSLFARLVRNGTTVTPMLGVWRYTPGRYVGLSGSASTAACSAGSSKVPVSAS